MRTTLLLLLAALLGCESPVSSPDLRPDDRAASEISLYQVTEVQAYELAYTSIGDELGYDPPRRPAWKYWRSTLSYGYSGGSHQHLIWTIGADFSPGGGGVHASVRIHAQTGEVLDVYVGRHLR